MSNIEWTEKTWNPVTGCSKTSAGCKFCYAETMAKRLYAMNVPGYENKFSLTLQPQRLDYPKKIKKPTTFFVNSMSDLFHPQVPFDYIDKIMEVISTTPMHRYQILTKRPKRMAQYFSAKNRVIPKNTWLGTTVENIKHGVPRIEILQSIQFDGIKFLSIEPLLEDIGRIKLNDIDWVIVGGESGQKARPMRESWVDSIYYQCKQQQVPFFFKQWGAWGNDGIKRNKKINGRIYKNKTWDLIPVS